VQLAHTADLMLVLGKNRQTGKDDLEKILQGIANKLVHSTNWVYIYEEDDRLANTVMMIRQRNLVSIDLLKTWLESFTKPGKSWTGAYMDEDQAKAFHNSRSFLRSLFVNIHTSNDLPGKDEVKSLINESVSALVPY
jgi:hypothetical protein